MDSKWLKNSIKANGIKMFDVHKKGCYTEFRIVKTRKEKSNMTLEEMKRIKQERGFSMAQLSEYSGVPLGILQKLFSGETGNHRYATTQALEKALTKEDSSYSVSPNSKKVVAEAQPQYDVEPEKKQGEYTLEDYYSLPDDRHVELIDGVFYDMAAPTIVHQRILGKFFTMLEKYIEDNEGPCLPMMAPVDVRLDCDDKTMVQPDVLILCDEWKLCRCGVMGAPDFCLEIISESSCRKDCTKKLQKYTDAGVKEYWIIDPIQKKLITYAWKDDYLPHMYPLEGKIGLALYDGNLLIDLDVIAGLIKEYPEGGRDS